eukprot:1091125-Pleurochrysis_carterae.AAC.1
MPPSLHSPSQDRCSVKRGRMTPTPNWPGGLSTRSLFRAFPTPRTRTCMHSTVLTSTARSRRTESVSPC